MASQQQGRGTIAVLGVIAAAVVVVLFGVLKWDLRIPARSISTEQIEPPPHPAPAAESQVQAALPIVSTAGPSAEPTPPASPPSEPEEAHGPTFDVVRVEPNGESVIAGRGVPGATIELLRNGQVHARAAADQSGLFALIPPPFPPGSHQVTLQSIAPDGTRQRSHDTVTIIVNEGRNTRPLVALTTPDKPTVLLSNPEPPDQKMAQKAAPEPASEPASKRQAGVQTETAASSPAAQPAAPRPEVNIVSVETEEGGRLYVSGQAAPGATVRLYLNETFIAPGGAGGDGKVSFAIGRGVRPGDYRVRLDDVDPVSGSVKSRAEVAFNVPPTVASAVPVRPAPAKPAPIPAIPPVADIQSQPQRQPPGPQDEPRSAASLPGGSPSRDGTPVAAASPEAGVPVGTVVIPDVVTAIVARGDNLWRISQRIYGRGNRYTVIYDANQTQIRNPNLIFPGQVFVLPSTETQRATR